MPKTLFFSLLLSLIALPAQAEFFVIPVPQPQQTEQVKYLVTVSPEGQGGDFNDIQEAIYSVSNQAIAARQYTVYVAEGSYQVFSSIVMQPYVHLVGSGINNTFITGRLKGRDATSSLITGADNSIIANLTIHNQGSLSAPGAGDGSTFKTTGIYNNQTSPKLHNLKIVAEGGAGYTRVVGIYNDSSNMKADNVEILLRQYDEYTYEATGIKSTGNSDVTLSNGKVTGGRSGVWSDPASASTTNIINSLIAASGAALFNSSAFASQIDADHPEQSLDAVCYECKNRDGRTLNPDCDKDYAQNQP